MEIATFSITILLVYLVGLKTISYFAFRLSSQSTADYFLSSRSVGLIAIVATTMASIFSTGTVVSGPSEFFTKGSNYFWIFFFGMVPLAMLPFVVKFWKLGKTKGFITPGEMLGDFYKSRRLHVLIGVVGILSLIPYAAAQLVAVGKTFEALTDGVISYNWGISIVTVAIGLYLYYGGSRAVIWTDVVQGIIFSSLLITTAFLTISWAGGFEKMISNWITSPKNTAKFNVTIGYYEYLPICLSFFLLPYVWQRMYMAKSATAVVRNLTILSVVIVVMFSVTWIIGISAISLFPEGLTDGDNVLGSIFRAHAPYFGAFVLVAAFAAGMSTVDSQLLSAGSLFTNDFFIAGKKRTDTQSYNMARFVTLSLMLLIFIWSVFLKSKSVMSLIILGVSACVVLAPAVIGMFFWSRASEKAAFWSVALGILALLAREFLPSDHWLPVQLTPATWGLLVASCSFIGISLLTSSKNLADKRAEYAKILNDRGELVRIFFAYRKRTVYRAVG